MGIRITNQTSKYVLPHSKLTKLIKKILRVLGVKKAGLGVFFCNDRKIRALNKKYLRHDRPTDVIAFGLGEGARVQGDIVISLETTERQALEYGNTFDYELAFYLCHGILHLLGWKDKTPKQRKRMWEKQKAVLKQLRIQ